MWDGDKEPDDAGDGKKYRGEEKAVVVSELGDGGRRGESGSSAGDFVEDMLDDVRRSDGPQRVVTSQHTTVASILLNLLTLPPTMSHGLEKGDQRVLKGNGNWLT